jgi:integrase
MYGFYAGGRASCEQGEGWSEGALPEDLRTRLNIFASCFPNEIVSDFNTARIDDWLRGLPHSAVTRNNYRRLLGVLFSFAVQRGYAHANPVTKSSKAKEIKRPPGILTVEQTTRLLKRAQPEILPALVFGLFAGLRPESEVWHLDWSNVDFESRLIDVGKSKLTTARNRFVHMTDNLVAWLLPHRQPCGPVSPTGDKYNQLLQGARKAAGITIGHRTRCGIRLPHIITPNTKTSVRRWRKRATQTHAHFSSTIANG